MTLDTDPITLVWNALLDMLESHAGFMSLVKVGNLIRFTGKNRDPVKSQIGPADVPEVRLIPRGGIPHVQRTSNSSSMLETFEVQITSGDQRVDVALFPVKWQVLKALAGWAAVLGALTWKGKTFVRLTRPTGVADGVAEEDLRRGIVGWASIWTVEVHMWFTTTDLQGD